MNAQTKDEISRKIRSEIDKAQQEISRLKELVKPISPDNAIGRLSRMEAISAKSVNEAALSSVQNKLMGLQRALANIDEPEFGTCFECGEAIPLGRILLMPAAKLCVGCAEQQE